MRYSAPVILRIPKPRFGTNGLRRKLVLFILFISLLTISSLVKSKFFPPPKEASAQVACGNRPASFTILLDRSGSMGVNNKLTNARNASISFVNRLYNYTTNPVSYAGAISIANETEANPPAAPPITKLEWRLTQFYSNVIEALEKLTTAGGGTCISCGIKLSNEQFSLYSSDGRRKNVVILISDGGATRTLDGTSDQSKAWDEALAYASQSVSQYNTTYYVINLDPDIGNFDFRRMNQLVNLNQNQPGMYFSEDSSNIDDALDRIFNIYGSASISGFKYADTNKNSTYDRSTETGLENWTIRLNQPGVFSRSTVTDSTGHYRFDEVCNGDYTLTEVEKAGWDAINPPSGGSIPVAIRNLISVQNQNFGNVQNPPIHSISGTVFLDNNPQDNKFSSGEQAYSGQVEITHRLLEPGTLPVTRTYNSAYSIPNLVQGRYEVKLTYISPYNTYPDSRTFRVTVGPNMCTFDPNLALDAACVNNNITGLNFGLQTTDSWTQTTGLDVRWDDGWINNIPTGAFCESHASKTESSSTPGVIISGDQNSDFSPGRASVREWVVGNPTFREKFAKTGKLQTSYSQMRTTIERSGTDIIPINHPTLGACADQNSCTLIGDRAHGAFSVEGDLKINSGSIDTADTTQTVILVDGDVYINGEIHVKEGNFLMVIASGEIIVNRTIGDTVPVCARSDTPHIEGVFVSDSNFNVDGINNCFSGTDRMLTLAGTYVVNAARLGGSFNNGRSLCEKNIDYPSVLARERPDFILNAPDYIQSQSTIWKEVAP